MIFQNRVSYSQKALLVQTLILALTFSFSSARAQDGETYILKSRGKKVMIQRGEIPMRKGALFVAYDEDERRRGVIRITRVGRTKALGRVVKGKARAGWYLEKYRKRSRKRPREEFTRTRGEEREEFDDPGAIKNPWRIGALIGYAMNSMTVNIPVNTTTATSNMSGNSLEFHGMATYRIAPKGVLLGTIGLQNFEVTGTTTDNACSDSNDCTTKISYLMATGNYKLELGEGDFKPWIAGGLGLLNPLSSESNAIDATSIGLTTVLLATAGFDYKLNREYSMPVMIRYAHFLNNNDSVSTNLLAILVGIDFEY